MLLIDVDPTFTTAQYFDCIKREKESDLSAWNDFHNELNGTWNKNLSGIDGSGGRDDDLLFIDRFLMQHVEIIHIHCNCEARLQWIVRS